MPFRIGESVAQLGYWQPQMTVESVDDNIVACVWFDDEGQLLRERFVSNNLEPWTAPNHQVGEGIPFCDIGELVQLRSNGFLQLTVRSQPVGSRVLCSWADREESFVVETLVRWPDALVVEPA